MGGGVGETAALANFIAAMTTAAEGAAVAAPAAASAALPAAAGAAGAGALGAAKALPATTSSISSMLPGGEMMGGWLAGNTGIGAEGLAGGTKLGGILGGQGIGAGIPATARPDFWKLMMLANSMQQQEESQQMGAAPSGGMSARSGEVQMPQEPNPIEQLFKQRRLSQMLGGGYG